MSRRQPERPLGGARHSEPATRRGGGERGPATSHTWIELSHRRLPVSRGVARRWLSFNSEPLGQPACADVSGEKLMQRGPLVI